MRVIAGSAKHMTLKTIDSMDTRPTTDRIKETLFNILHFDLPGKAFLDLFSGSGAIGIEALSRGAASAVFIENNPKALKVIQENLMRTRLQAEAEVVAGDCVLALNRLRGRGLHFDFVFMDPPYHKGLALRALETLRGMDYVDQSTVFIVEAEKQEDLSDAAALGYAVVREKVYKTNKHVFFRLEG